MRIQTNNDMESIIQKIKSKQDIKELNDQFFQSVDKSIEDKLTKKYGRIINMQELTFEVMGIQIERRTNGTTNMRLMCVQDNVIVDIEIANSMREDKSLIREKAIKEHNHYLELKARNLVDVGTII